MQKTNVKIGHVYTAKVSGKITKVRIEEEITTDTPWLKSKHTHWRATNLTTGREIRIRSAARLRTEVSQ